MKYVLDASVALKWVLPEPDSGKALALRDSFDRRLDELIAPHFFLMECGYSLFRAQNKKLIQPGQPRKLLTSILSHAPILKDVGPLLPRAVEMSEQMGVGFYDAFYLALAEAEACEFVTADTKLINAVSGKFSLLVDLASLP
jgi:predicted nucleic acid-binding protein